MRIAIYSGSFNPVHSGHLEISKFLIARSLVDEVWLLVSKINPLKQDSPPASEEHRLKMASIAVENHPEIRVSDFELHLPSPSFTYLTLRKLKEQFPQHQFVLIIGADNWNIFHKWGNYQEILDGYEMLVYPREGEEINENSLPENVKFLADAPLFPVSSTDIRQRLKHGSNLQGLIPSAVMDYIRINNLYG